MDMNDVMLSVEQMSREQIEASKSGVMVSPAGTKLEGKLGEFVSPAASEKLNQLYKRLKGGKA